MFDKDTLIITYDERRGEPRGARRKGVDPKSKGLGDCVDCTLCVQVCPTGIDIRKGLQYECIACAACIDACDEVMDKVGYPRGLVRYDTQHGIEGKTKHVLRPRTIVYATLLALLSAGLAYSITHRDVVAVDILRDRNALYRERPDGASRTYNVKILNKDSQDQNSPSPRAACPASRSITQDPRSGSAPARCRACRYASAFRRTPSKAVRTSRLKSRRLTSRSCGPAARRASLRLPTTEITSANEHAHREALVPPALALA
jgi:ferredoxin